MNTSGVLGGDVVIIGAGPAGSAAAIWSARHGYDVLVIDQKEFPRDKTCGDGLTPRAIAQLYDLGLTSWVDSMIHHQGLHIRGFHCDLNIYWPQCSFPAISSAVPRYEFDNKLCHITQESGARMLLGHAVIDVENHSNGSVKGLTLANGTKILCKKLIVADGARSPIGRLLGRRWHKNLVHGVAGRAYISSPYHAQPWMSSDLELRDPQGELLPGYGWIFPLGTGKVNIGVGTLATSSYPAKVSLKSLLKHYVRQCSSEWGFYEEPQYISSALLPMGGAVSHVAGPNWMLIGDAAGCINPLNGEGIDYGLETGRLASQYLDLADVRYAWPQALFENYGASFSIARRLAVLLASPWFLPLAGPVGMRSEKLMNIVVRTMGNLITDEDTDLVARLWHKAGRYSYQYDNIRPFW